MERVITLKFASTQREFLEKELDKDNFAAFYPTMSANEKEEFSIFLRDEKNFNPEWFIQFYSAEGVNEKNRNYFFDTMLYVNPSHFSDYEDVFNFEKPNNYTMNHNSFKQTSFLVKTNAMLYSKKRIIDSSDNLSLIAFMETIFENRNDSEIAEILENNSNLYTSMRDLYTLSSKNNVINHYLFNKSEDFLRKIVTHLPFVLKRGFFDITEVDSHNINITRANKPDLLKEMCDEQYAEILSKDRSLLAPVFESALSSIYFYSSDLSEFNKKVNTILSMVDLKDKGNIYKCIVNNDKFKEMFMKNFMNFAGQSLDSHEIYKKELSRSAEMEKINAFVSFFIDYIDYDEFENFLKNNYMMYKKMYNNEVEILSDAFKKSDKDISDFLKEYPEMNYRDELIKTVKTYAIVYFEIKIKQGNLDEVADVFNGNAGSDLYELSSRNLMDLKLQEDLGVLFTIYDTPENINFLKDRCKKSGSHEFFNQIHLFYEKHKLSLLLNNDKNEIIEKVKKRL